MDESDATPTERKPVACESILWDGKACLVPTWYFVSYSEGDAFPMCMPHMLLAMEEVRLDTSQQLQEWVVSYA